MPAQLSSASLQGLKALKRVIYNIEEEHIRGHALTIPTSIFYESMTGHVQQMLHLLRLAPGPHILVAGLIGFAAGEIIESSLKAALKKSQAAAKPLATQSSSFAMRRAAYTVCLLTSALLPKSAAAEEGLRSTPLTRRHSQHKPSTQVTLLNPNHHKVTVPGSPRCRKHTLAA